MATPLVIVKIGGQALDRMDRPDRPDAIDALADDMRALHGAMRLLVVHGGGNAISRLTDLMGITPRFLDGVRLTSLPEMAAVDMVLCGLVNKRLARRMQAAGIPTLGLACSDGGMIIGEPIGDPRSGETRTGRVLSCQPALLEMLLSAGWLPIVAPTIMDHAGGGLNLNADDAALALATAMHADTLIFCSDVAGVMLEKNRPIATLSVSMIEQEIARGSIRDGMAVKTRACAHAVQHGVGQIVIGEHWRTGDLQRLIDGKTGTRITL